MKNYVFAPLILTSELAAQDDDNGFGLKNISLNLPRVNGCHTKLLMRSIEI